MTVLPFLGIAFGASAASLLLRQKVGLSTGIGLLGLLAAAIAAAGISGDSTTIGGGQIVGSAYLRLFALLGSLVGLALVVLGLMTTSHRHAPGVLLAGIGAAALAIALPDPRIAVITATAGGLIGILVTVAAPATPRGVLVSVRELRALAVAGALAILATAWIGRPLAEIVAQPAVFGLAYLGFAIGVAIRFGAIPFHFWAARLADAAPEISLPLLMAWGPAAFAVVALAWVDRSVAPLLLPLTLERALVVITGAASVILGSLAAWIQDDLEHVVGYTIVADAGIAILALAALDPASWEPARTWIIVFVMTRSAFAAWAVALRGAFGTRRVPDLSGWALRAPLLGIALLLIVVASIGWPGLVVWQARATLIDLALDGPFLLLVTLGALAPLAVYGRLAAIGLRRPSALVARAPGERPHWPAPQSPAAMSPAATSAPRAGIAAELGLALDRARTRARAGSAISELPEAIRLNRTGLASILVAALAALSLVVSSGGLGVVEAARAVPGELTEPAVSPSPSGSAPAASGSPAASAVPSASASTLESEPPASGPSFQPVPTP